MIYIATCQIQGFHYHQDIRLQVFFNVWQPAYIRSDSGMIFCVTSRLNLNLTQIHVKNFDSTGRRTLTYLAEHSTRTRVQSRFS